MAAGAGKTRKSIRAWQTRGPVLVAFASLSLLSGCHILRGTPDRSWISNQVTERMAHDLGPATPPHQFVLPPGACLEDGLTEDEAIAIALWNNPAFLERLVDLGLTRADIILAGQLPNPELWLLSPVGVKQLEYAIETPIDAFYLRPIRVAAARFENARTGERLVQTALDLIRDVRQAYADLITARERLQVANEAVRLRGEVARIAEARLKAGDASAQEAATARIDGLVAQQDAARIRYDVPLAEERLRWLLGLMDTQGPLLLDTRLPEWPAEVDLDALTREAVANRPDVLSADQAVGAAEERVRLARLAWIRFNGIVDANGRGDKGFESGPGFRLTLPLLNWNRGGRRRAEADLEQAQRRQTTVHNQVILDVRLALARFQQARAEYDILMKQVRPEVEATIGRAEKAYREGNTTYVVVLEATRQELDSIGRRAILHAELRRSWAELERSVGRRLGPTPPGTPAVGEPHP